MTEQTQIRVYCTPEVKKNLKDNNVDFEEDDKNTNIVKLTPSDALLEGISHWYTNCFIVPNQMECKPLKYPLSKKLQVTCIVELLAGRTPTSKEEEWAEKYKKLRNRLFHPLGFATQEEYTTAERNMLRYCKDKIGNYESELGESEEEKKTAWCYIFVILILSELTYLMSQRKEFKSDMARKELQIFSAAEGPETEYQVKIMQWHLHRGDFIRRTESSPEIPRENDLLEERIGWMATKDITHFIEKRGILDPFLSQPRKELLQYLENSKTANNNVETMETIRDQKLMDNPMQEFLHMHHIIKLRKGDEPSLKVRYQRSKEKIDNHLPWFKKYISLVQEEMREDESVKDELQLLKYCWERVLSSQLE